MNYSSSSFILFRVSLRFTFEVVLSLGEKRPAGIALIMLACCLTDLLLAILAMVLSFSKSMIPIVYLAPVPFYGR